MTALRKQYVFTILMIKLRKKQTDTSNIRYCYVPLKDKLVNIILGIHCNDTHPKPTLITLKFEECSDFFDDPAA